MRQTLESVDAMTHQVEELARALRSYRDGIEYSPARLQELEERLDLINSLKRKYGGTIEEILAFGERASQELEKLYYSEERVEGLKSREIDLRKQVGRLAGQLSEARQHAAKRLADAIQEEVAGLALGHAQVLGGYPSIRLGGRCAGWDRGLGPDATHSSGGESHQAPSVQRDRYRLRGILDLTEPGRAAPAPSQVASGGEASRLMLAIKTILSTADQIPILVFDEIDAGIGGRLGSVLGQKLWGLSKSHQVLCVTHLPQIACYADHHAKVTKFASHDRTVTSVEVLDDEASVTELSQMLGSESGATRTNALEMLQQAKSWKESKRVHPIQGTLA